MTEGCPRPRPAARPTLLARALCGALLLALPQLGCSAPSADPAEPAVPVIQPAQGHIGGRAMVLIPRQEMLERRVRDQQQAVEQARALRDVRLSQLYDDPGLRRTLRKILYLHGTPAAEQDDPARLLEAWQAVRFEVAGAPLGADLSDFVDRSARQSREQTAALERSGAFDEVKVVEAYAPGFQRVAFGESGYDYMIWPVPDYLTRSIRWHMIRRGALDKREVFSNPLTAGPNVIILQDWLDSLGEKARALQP